MSAAGSAAPGAVPAAGGALPVGAEGVPVSREQSLPATGVADGSHTGGSAQQQDDEWQGAGGERESAVSHLVHESGLQGRRRGVPPV